MNPIKIIYKLYRLISFLVVFKKEKVDFEIAADSFVILLEGDEQAKQVGAALMSAERAQERFLATKEMLKNYANNWFHDRRPE